MKNKSHILEVISKLRLGQASPSMFTPVSGVEGRACHDHFLSFEISSLEKHIVQAVPQKRRTLFFLSVLLFLLLAVPAFSSDISMKVSPQPLMAGEPAQIELSSSEDYPEIIDFPRMSEISWRQGASKSMQTNIINFKRSTKYMVRYTFVPQKEGELTIPGLDVRQGKKKVITDPVTIKVLSRRYSVNSATADKSNTKESARLEDLLFMKCIPLTDRNSIYIGEEIYMDVKIYSVSGLNFEPSWPEINIENAAFRDFSAVNDKNSRFQPFRESVEKIMGQTFKVLIFRTALRPISSGTLSGKVVERCNVVIPNDNRSTNQRRDPFDDFFSDGFMSPFSNYRKLEQTLTCDVPAITVKQLPDVNGIKNFLGLIGKWTVKTSLSQEKLKTGEPVTLRVTASGDGTTDTLKAPELRIEGFRVYPPEVKKSDVSGKNRVEISYVLIPLQEGTADINLIVSYFSVESGKYVEVPFSEKIKVEKSDIKSASVVADSSAPAEQAPVITKKYDEAKKHNGILYLKRNPSGEVLLPLWKNHIFLMLFFFIFGPAACGISEFYYWRKLKLEKDPLLKRKMKALSIKSSIIREIRNSEPDKMHALIQNRVVPYLNDLLGLPPGTTASELAGKINDPELSSYLRAGSDSAYMPGSLDIKKSDIRKSLADILKRISAVLILAALPFSGFSAEKTLAEPVNPLKAYDMGDFAKSADYYRQHLNMSSPDPAILYNLANCLYQQGEPAKALVLYERALLLSPRDSDIRENLNLVCRKLMLPETGRIDTPKDLLVNARDMLRPDEWMLIGSMLWVCAWIVLAFRRKFTSPANLAAILSVIGLLFVLTAVASISEFNSAYSSKTAFVIMKNTQVYLLPSENSKQTDFRISCGGKVRIEETREGWLRVRTENGSEGWIKSDAAEKLLK
jgi:tetratricopeptide (TPR) repeat protein